jgi:hypothetical protein
MYLDWLNYYSIPWLNGNLASAEKFSGPLRFRLRQVLLYFGKNTERLVTLIYTAEPHYNGLIGAKSCPF